MFQIALIVIGVIVLMAVLISLADSLIQIEAKKSGIDTETKNMSLWPSIGSLWGPKVPDFTTPSKFHKISKGHNIKVAGNPTGAVQAVKVDRYSVRPQNYRGIAPIPKMVVEVGNEVKAGDPLFFDKTNPDVHYVAPVSGEVIEINRGEKRAIIDVVILADKEQKFKSYDTPKDVSREGLVQFLASSGLWPNFIQRPFGVVASLTDIPRDIFVTGFSTAPMAPDANLSLENNIDHLNKGFEILAQLTDGNVFFSLNPSQKEIGQVTKIAEVHYFDGPHPAGNVGIQIHHIKSIKGADMVWTLSARDVITLGNLFNTGQYIPERIVSVGGKVEEPKLIKTMMGANVGELLKGQLQDDNLRIIAGDVLTGKHVSEAGYLNVHDNQLSVIKEGDYHEPFGWLLPIKPRPSVSGTFPNFLFPNHEFELDTNTHGEERAFVVTGQYEKVLPMDIYPQHLMKAILTGNIERMEGLGINELLEEDIALAEFTCTSKQPLQSILRDGLDMMMEQI